MSYINFESGGTLKFPRTYQLWESSSNELSPRDILDEHSGEGPSQTANEEVIRDAKNRRIISKASLYDSERISKQNVEKIAPSNDSSLGYKEKTGDNMGTVQWRQKPNTTKLQKKIDKAVSKPLKIDKAASMMAKMGWQGGALGKSGTGIMEPIIPNAIYATKTSGFGQPDPIQVNPFRKKKKAQNVQPSKKQQKKLDRGIFRSNVLTSILEFLQNDFETELMFDCSLDNRERKQIHELMQKLNDKSLLKGSAGFGDLHELLLDIHRYQYVLSTQSEGELSERALCVYKDAPPYMFLVTHHDLRNEPEEIIEEKTNLDTNMEDECDIVETSNRESPIVIDDDDEYEDYDLELDTDEDANFDTENAKENILEKSEEDAKELAVVVEHSKSAPNGLETVDAAGKPENSVATESFKQGGGSENDKTAAPELMLNVTETKGKLPVKKPVVSSKEHRKHERYKKFRAKFLEKQTQRQPSKRKALADVLKKNTVISKQKLSYNTSTREEISNLIFEYFNAFVKDSNYNEFKFLGAFEGLEVELINEFISDVWRFAKDADYVSDAVYTVMNGASCSVAVKEDCNGSAVIYKTKKNVVGTKT